MGKWFIHCFCRIIFLTSFRWPIQIDYKLTNLDSQCCCKCNTIKAGTWDWGKFTSTKTTNILIVIRENWKSTWITFKFKPFSWHFPLSAVLLRLYILQYHSLCSIYGDVCLASIPSWAVGRLVLNSDRVTFIGFTIDISISIMSHVYPLIQFSLCPLRPLYLRAAYYSLYM